jgi:uridine monophosphate synthetase
MKTFFSRLTNRIQAADSLLCLGLDPHLQFLPQPSAEAARAFCQRMIEQTADLVCAFKPNSAFFEAFGSQGWLALEQVIEAVPDGIPVILDAKRGDIASTATAYARAAFEFLGVDAITASPYLGPDALEPLLSDPKRAVFMLCKTSNPGADEIQRLPVAPEGEPLYVHLARRAARYGGPENLGLVVGATDPQAMAAVRQAASGYWILAPGVGAQGGNLEAALQAGLWPDGMGMVIPASRSIAQAGNPRAEADRLRQAINRLRGEVASKPAGRLPPVLADLADDLMDAGCVRFGQFTMKSGIQSPIYIDLRLLASRPRLLGSVAAAYSRLLEGLSFDLLAALPYAGMPITTALALQTGKPMIYARKETKAYGTQAPVEGAYQEGETAVVIDDLVTTGESKFESIERLESVGLRVREVVVLIDRESGARQRLQKAGYRLHAVFTLGDMIDHWEAKGALPAEQVRKVREFLEKQ